MDKLNIAIIGCGWAGEKHVRALQKLPARANVSALVDTDAAFLAKKAAEWGISDGYKDYRDMLSRDDIDAVSICLPHNIHSAVAVDCARAGKHILCEKPIAVSVEEADAMIQAADENHIKLMVAESAHFQAINQRIKSVISDGCIGNPILIRQAFLPRMPVKTGYIYPGRRSWLSDRKIAGGGQWMVNGVHNASVARSFFGEVESIYATHYQTDEFRLDIEANMCVSLKFVNGTLGQMIFIPQASHFGVFDELMIHGDSGAIVFGGSDETLHVYSENINERNNHKTIEIKQDEDPFFLEMKHFLDHVQEDAPCICGGASERRSLAVVAGGFESMRTGKPVIL
jgi:predicted dehydrogenase